MKVTILPPAFNPSGIYPRAHKFIGLRAGGLSGKQKRRKKSKKSTDAWVRFDERRHLRRLSNQFL